LSVEVACVHSIFGVFREKTFKFLVLVWKLAQHSLPAQQQEQLQTLYAQTVFKTMEAICSSDQESSRTKFDPLQLCCMLSIHTCSPRDFPVVLVGSSPLSLLERVRQRRIAPFGVRWRGRRYHRRFLTSSFCLVASLSSLRVSLSRAVFVVPFAIGLPSRWLPALLLIIKPRSFFCINRSMFLITWKGSFFGVFRSVFARFS
jgi:hypothetical protein